MVRNFNFNPMSAFFLENLLIAYIEVQKTNRKVFRERDRERKKKLDKILFEIAPRFD